jgi:hypothetical protein
VNNAVAHAELPPDLEEKPKNLFATKSGIGLRWRALRADFAVLTAIAERAVLGRRVGAVYAVCGYTKPLRPKDLFGKPAGEKR